MNVRISALFLAVFMLLFSLQGHTQINPLSTQNLSAVRIDDIPDSDIRMYLAKAKENGISEQNMYRILLEKGLPQEEVNKLINRVAVLNKAGYKIEQPSEQESNSQRDKNRFENQDATNIPQQKERGDLSIFGSELFTSSSLVFEPNLRIPTPPGYILGPDDEIIVNVFGLSEKTYNLTVNEEGNIYIPQVGPMFVNGLSMEQAASKIRAKLASTIYKAIGSGRTRVQISLGKIRSIRVTVIGEAKKPGTYTVSSLTTVFNLLYLCGGPSDLGSYRKIELIRGNELKKTIDLYTFLSRGNQQDNILLNEGDVIRIPYYVKRVLLNGGIKHPGKYELTEAETFENLMQYSGGFSDDSYKAGVTVYQYTESERRITDIGKNNFATYKPQSGDSVIAIKLLERFENKLSIAGAVTRPGVYELAKGMTLKDLIEKAGGTNEDVYSTRGSISRLSSNLLPVNVSFNVDSVLKNQQVIYLKRNDSVTVYSIFDMMSESVVRINGVVKSPGKYKWVGNITLNDLLLMAGGVLENGDLANIEIARRINNASILQENHMESEIINVDLTDPTSPDVLLKPFDVINVRRQAGFTNQRSVIIEGMVVNPGRYTLKMSGDRINDLVQRAGGFRANADTTALIIKRVSQKGQSDEEREKVLSKLLNIDSDSINSTERIKNEIYREYDKISIDLNKALKENKESDNMLLEDGDILTIEQNSNLVKVSGEVYFPTIIPFKKGENLKYYIQKSGSYTELARKRGTLVLYPDGKAKKVKRFLFFKSYPEVVSRSEIFVPQKSDSNRSKITASEWAVILSSLGIIANVIVNLSK